MTWYSDRNTRILASLAEGMTIAEAAQRYYLSEKRICEIAHYHNIRISKRKAVNKLTQMRYR
jgi:uncharacterized protein (DUF433 family)